VKPAIFFDRDGVINEVVMVDGYAHSPMSMDNFLILPGIKKTIRKLKSAGFIIFVITNQPEISRGNLDSVLVDSMNQIIKDELKVDDIRVCPHDRSDGCTCRKPLPGMIDELCGKWLIDRSNSWVVGDRWVDILSAKKAGLKSVLLEQEYSWKTSFNEDLPLDLIPGFTIRHIDEISNVILGDK
jgi:D-glycero-D-manno-heptose 1,7-bisphosphate phosphatase